MPLEDENTAQSPPWITLEETHSTAVQIQLWPQGGMVLRHLTLSGQNAWLVNLSANSGDALRALLRQE